MQLNNMQSAPQILNSLTNENGVNNTRKEDDVTNDPIMINDIERQQKKRDNWAGELEFLMSCISVSVGLGNIWRFPFTAYENGGGAFLIPYIIVLLLIGKPMYYLEVLLGQFTSKSSVKIWSVCPAFVGVGIGQAYAGVAVLTYYSSLLAITLHYLVGSCQAILPWSHCRLEWGDNCVDSKGGFTKNSSINDNQTIQDNDGQLQSSSELYFLRDVIRESDDISNGIGTPSWQLTIALFCAWLITFLVIVRGVKATGKAAYFLALFPYVILITLLIRAVTLEGAIDGIIFFLKPNWNELLNLKVWMAAVVQCFFSLAVGLGPIVMFSSYNRFGHNAHRDAVIVTTLDTFTSLLAGITIFGILGNLAHNLQANSIEEVVRSGTGLAFISYPDAIAKFEGVPQLFAILFFFMLFVLGIGTLVAQANTLVTILCDQYKWMRAWAVALATCVGGFFSGIVYVTPAGQWILNLVDYYGCTFVIFGLAVFQIIGIAWIYGIQNFCDDVEFMTKHSVSWYWRLCWTIFTPLLLLLIFIYSMVEIQTLTYAGQDYPHSANVVGWTLLAIGFSQFPLWFIWTIAVNWEDGLIKTLLKCLQFSSNWGPDDPLTKKEWLQYKHEQSNRRRTDAQTTTKINIFFSQVRNVFCGDNQSR